MFDAVRGGLDVFRGGGCCLEGNAVHERAMVSRMLVLSGGGEGGAVMGWCCP